MSSPYSTNNSPLAKQIARRLENGIIPEELLDRLKQPGGNTFEETLSYIEEVTPRGSDTYRRIGAEAPNIRPYHMIYLELTYIAQER